jgi:hypothetical protein
MKFAPVCPINIYEGLAEKGPEYLGDYFLLLAHDVLDKPKRYEALFKGKDYTIIMDNSVIELGDACTAQNLYDACEIVGATCLAIPDVLREGYKTIRSTYAFINDWAGMQRERDYAKMFIPQGSDAIDFIRCVDVVLGEMDIYPAWLGVPRNVVGNVFPSRKLAVGYISSKVLETYYCKKGIYPRPSIHLLGFSDDTIDDFQTCETFPNLVAGIDSAVPLRLAAQSYTMGSGIALPDPGPRGSWWDYAEMNELVAHNVLMTRELVKEIL